MLSLGLVKLLWIYTGAPENGEWPAQLTWRCPSPRDGLWGGGWSDGCTFFPFPCREFVEQPRDSSPVCIYMRDEVSHQLPPSVLENKESPALLSNLENVFSQTFLERGSRRALVFSKPDVFVWKKSSVGT